MNKILRIATTEFLTSIRSKAFILGALAVPIFSIIAIIVAQFAAGKKDTSEKRFVIIDETGLLGEAIVSAAEKRGEITPRFIASLEKPVSDDDTQLLDLSAKVRNGELFAFIVLEKGLDDAEDFGNAARYYTDTPTYNPLPNWLKFTLTEEITRIRFERSGLDQDQVEKLVAKPVLRTLGLTKTGEDGEIEGGDEENTLLRTGIPVVMMFMLFVMVMTAAPALLTTTLEEKMNKVSEFLVSAVSPFQLMMGKLLGALGTSAALAVLYLGASSGLAAYYGFLEMIPLSFYLWFFFFLFLSVMIFGSACVAIGSVCSEIRDAQSLMMPITLMLAIPAMLWQPVLEAPDSSFARAVTYFPPATPMMMLLRNSIPPGLPLWELILGTVVCIVFMLFTVWAAGKIFRIGLLAQGQTPSMAKLIRWVFSK